MNILSVQTSCLVYATVFGPTFKSYSLKIIRLFIRPPVRPSVRQSVIRPWSCLADFDFLSNPVPILF